MSEMNIRKIIITNRREILLGIPLFCNQKKGGDAIIEIKIASRKGTIIDSAACIPATIITKEESINNS